MNKRQGQQPPQNKYRQPQQQQKQQKQQQQKYKTNPKKLRRTSINDIESIIDVPIHDSLEDAANGTTTVIEYTTTYYKRYDLLNLTILLSLILVFLTFILIIITFIFPNWLIISLQLQKLNLDDVIVSNTIINNDITTLNTSIGRTEFDIGLWELKLNQTVKILNSQNQILTLKNTITNQTVNNQTKYSLLWLNDYDLIYNDYIRELLRLIDFTKSTVFVIQILEILHLIFTFILIVLLFIILCLCKKNYFGRGIKLWHFVSYIIGIVSFFMGLGTLIQISLWQNGKNTKIRDIKFNWCYWCLVAELGAMLLVVLLIQVNLVFACVECYKRRHPGSKSKKPTKSIVQDIDNVIIPPAYIDKPISANSRSTAGLINNRSKATPNISTIEVTQNSHHHHNNHHNHNNNHQEHLIRPSSLLNSRRQSQQQQQQQQSEYLNDRIIIPRPTFTSSNTNIKSASSNNSKGFDNLIYYNGQSTYRTNN